MPMWMVGCRPLFWLVLHSLMMACHLFLTTLTGIPLLPILLLPTQSLLSILVLLLPRPLQTHVTSWRQVSQLMM